MAKKENWTGEERRDHGDYILTAQEQRIAEAAAEIVKSWVYQEIGRAATRALLLLAGAAGGGTAFTLALKDFLK